MRVNKEQAKDIWFRFTLGTDEGSELRYNTLLGVLRDPTLVESRVFCVEESEQGVPHIHARLVLHKTYGTFKRTLFKACQDAGVPYTNSDVWGDPWDDSKAVKTYRYICKGTRDTAPVIPMNDFGLVCDPERDHAAYWIEKDRMKEDNKTAAAKKPTRKLYDHLLDVHNNDRTISLLREGENRQVCYEMCQTAIDFCVNWKQGIKMQFIATVIMTVCREIERDKAERNFFGTSLANQIMGIMFRD